MKILHIFFRIFSFFLSSSIFCTNAFGADGTLYFPVAWKIESNSSIDSNRFTEGVINFHPKWGQTISFPFGSHTALTTNGQRGEVFLGRKTYKLPSGSYDSISFSVKYAGTKTNYDYKIEFKIENNQLTPLSAVLVHSELGGASLRSNAKGLILINRSGLDYDDLISNTGVSKNNINFLNTTSPIIVQEMKSRSSASARYGFVMNLPCGFRGIGQLNFSHNNDPIHYYKTIEGTPQSCHINTSTNKNPFDLYLTEGTWKIKSIAQAHVNEFRNLGFDSVNNSTLLKYFNTNREKFLRNNSYLKTISRNLTFNIDKTELSRPFLYAGTFEVQLNYHDGDYANVIFRPSFDLRNLRKVFKQGRIYNAYTGDRVTNDKVLGSVIVVFREVNIPRSVNTKMYEFRERAQAIIASCIQTVSQNDPLLYLHGSILFHNPNSDLSIIESERKFTSSSTTTKQFQECLKTKLVATRVSGVNVPVGFEANIYSL